MLYPEKYGIEDVSNLAIKNPVLTTASVNIYTDTDLFLNVFPATTTMVTTLVTTPIIIMHKTVYCLTSVKTDLCLC